MKSILVTGGAGYVGCVLVPKLLKKGYIVTVLDNMLFGDKGLNNVGNNPNLKIIEGDIRDASIVEKSLNGVDSVIHLAAISNDPCGDLDPKITREVNYEAVSTLVRLAKKKEIDRFINVSTSSVYGIKNEPNVTEELSLEPLTIYSKTKAEAEKIVLAANNDNFSTVNIRPATVCGYSPRMRLDLIVNILTSHAINKRKIIVYGGKQKRPNVHIDDITDLYTNLVEIPKDKIAGDVFNAGYENHTVLELAEMVKKIIGEDVSIEIQPTTDPRSYHISSEKIKKKLGFEPKRTIKDGVRDLKKAFESGLISDIYDTNYYNVKRMKQLTIK
jgi:nucleoside-diphosphate-sugar epimerase